MDWRAKERQDLIDRYWKLRAFSIESRRDEREVGIQATEFNTASAHQSCCPTCDGLQGEVFSIESAPHAPFHLDCGCFWNPVIDEVDLLSRPARNDFPLPWGEQPPPDSRPWNLPAE